MLTSIGTSVALAIVLKATFIASLALAGVRLARRGRAAVRHLVLLAGFTALLVLPVASILAPVVAIPITMPAEHTATPALDEAGSYSVFVTRADATAALGPTSAGWPMPSRSAILFGLWGTGVAAFLLPVLIGVWQVRALRRSARSWRRGRVLADALVREGRRRRQVDVLLHGDVPGPMTCGVLRPAIVLPRDAEAWAADELERAIVHELEHVRRGDWTSQCLARAACAAYWFHPLVWVAWRQLTLEAERACDDAVLRRAEATAYADQLVALARRISNATKSPVLAMANRRDLATRVGAVLDRRQPRGRAGAPLAATICGVAAAIVAFVSPLRMIAAGRQAAIAESREQTSSTSPAQFDVAAITPCAPGSAPNGGPKKIDTSANRFFLECVNVERLVNLAYRRNGDFVLNEQGLDWKVRGGPDWMRSDLYTIEATATGQPSQPTMMGPMLRALLEERFQLRIHRASEERPMYALTVAQGGLKIKPIAEGDCETHDPDEAERRLNQTKPNGPGRKPECGMITGRRRGGMRIWDLGGASMATLAGVLDVDRQILNRTGISDRFNIHLEYALDDALPVHDREASATAPDVTGPTVFGALEEQLGLKLVSTRGPHEYVVVDRLERPSNK
jgi:bla regulator protein blaR1